MWCWLVAGRWRGAGIPSRRRACFGAGWEGALRWNILRLNEGRRVEVEHPMDILPRPLGMAYSFGVAKYLSSAAPW
jgi:hypothetical protein